MKKAMVLDNGKSDNWVNTISPDDSFSLFVNDQYIGCITTDTEGNIIIVSTDHKVRLESVL